MSENFSTRVFNLLKARKKSGNKLTKDALADALGTSRTMLYNYENGDPEPMGEILSSLAELERDAGIEQTFTSPVVTKEAVIPYSSIGPGRTRMIPVLSWAHAGDAESYEELPKDWQDHITGDIGDDDGFALRLRGDSMEPRYYEGDILLVSPNRQPHNGCLVVVKFKTDGILFRQIEVSGETIRLVPINARYPVSEHAQDAFHWIYPVAEMRRRIWK